MKALKGRECRKFERSDVGENNFVGLRGLKRLFSVFLAKHSVKNCLALLRLVTKKRILDRICNALCFRKIGNIEVR